MYLYIEIQDCNITIGLDDTNKKPITNPNHEVNYLIEIEKINKKDHFEPRKNILNNRNIINLNYSEKNS